MRGDVDGSLVALGVLVGLAGLEEDGVGRFGVKILDVHLHHGLAPRGRIELEEGVYHTLLLYTGRAFHV
jgi:hypothetical protein